jgi:hypothetical protein
MPGRSRRLRGGDPAAKCARWASAHLDVPGSLSAAWVGPWDFALVILVVVALLIFWLVRDRTSSLRFGIFLEHRREDRKGDASEQDTKIMGPWPGDKEKP